MATVKEQRENSEATIALVDGYFERTERTQGQCMVTYGKPNAPERHEVWRYARPGGGLRYFIVKAKGGGKKIERELLMDAPPELQGTLELSSDGIRSRDHADLAARILQLSVPDK